LRRKGGTCLAEIFIGAEQKVERRPGDAEDARISCCAKGFDHSLARSTKKGAFGGGAGQGVRCGW
jgi:hypothetical protein